jgi:4,5:9,10-diseco-3-hydroxy-5,9,17-trioxoandrosta-1(10),2-diene-4-oate hydrolase
VKNEILVMWGLEDRVCPVDMAPGIIKAFPNASLHLLPNCGHWVQWEKPDDFNKLVAWFFDRN